MSESVQIVARDFYEDISRQNAQDNSNGNPVAGDLVTQISCMEAQDIRDDPHPDPEAEHAYRQHNDTCQDCREKQSQIRLAQATPLEA